jgi:hypothetical protein
LRSRAACGDVTVKPACGALWSFARYPDKRIARRKADMAGSDKMPRFVHSNAHAPFALGFGQIGSMVIRTAKRQGVS